jgi:transcription antitermination factor NusA-like protein
VFNPDEICAAIMLECVHMKHGRQLTLDHCMEGYLEALAINEVFEVIEEVIEVVATQMAAPSRERMN